ncbi:MAG: hypothetical protein NUW01_12220 [Gemmatimonadaceae bacterium]|nr:hypothetical protein [Gemmatimonadaceae bacterium]
MFNPQAYRASLTDPRQQDAFDAIAGIVDSQYSGSWDAWLQDTQSRTPEMFSPDDTPESVMDRIVTRSGVQTKDRFGNDVGPDWLDRNGPWLVPALAGGAIAAPVIAGAVGAGSAGAGGGTLASSAGASSATLPATMGGLSSPIGYSLGAGAATSGGGLAGMGAGAALPSALSSGAGPAATSTLSKVAKALKLGGIGTAAALPFLTGGNRETAGSSAQELLKQFPQLQEILNDMMQQRQQQAPLRQAVSQLSMNLLPKSAFGAYPGRDLGKTGGGQ